MARIPQSFFSRLKNNQRETVFSYNLPKDLPLRPPFLEKPGDGIPLGSGGLPLDVPLLLPELDVSFTSGKVDDWMTDPSAVEDADSEATSLTSNELLLFDMLFRLWRRL